MQKCKKILQTIVISLLLFLSGVHINAQDNPLIGNSALKINLGFDYQLGPYHKYVEYTPLATTIKLKKNNENISQTFPLIIVDQNGQRTDDTITFQDGVATLNTCDFYMYIITDLDYGTEYEINGTRERPGLAPFLYTDSGTIYNGMTETKEYRSPLTPDQYFFYYDTTGRQPTIKVHFEYNSHQNKMPVSYFDDGDIRVYYYDPASNSSDIIVESGRKTLLANGDGELSQSIHTTLKNDTTVRYAMHGSGYPELSEDKSEIEISDSWSYQQVSWLRLHIALDNVVIKPFKKVDPNGNPVDATFLAVTGNKALKTTHYDTFELWGTTYKNVYFLDGELEPLDYENINENQKIQPDENGEFYLAFSGRLLDTYGYDTSYTPESHKDSYNQELKSFNVEEIDCDISHLFEIRNVVSPGYNQVENFLQYPICSRNMMTASGNEAFNMFYNADLSNVQIDASKFVLPTTEVINYPVPKVGKMIVDSNSQPMSTYEEQEFWFDVYDENNNKVSEFSLKNNETINLDRNIAPQTTGLQYSFEYGKVRIKEREKDGWELLGARYNYRVWKQNSDGFYYIDRLYYKNDSDITFINRRQTSQLKIVKVFESEVQETTTTKFKVKLWDEEGTEIYPLKDFPISIGGQTFITDENGEIEIPILVSSGAMSNSVNFEVPSYAHYQITETECSDVNMKLLKTEADSGIFDKNSTTATFYNGQPSDLEVTKIYNEDYYEELDENTLFGIEVELNNVTKSNIKEIKTSEKIIGTKQEAIDSPDRENLSNNIEENLEYNQDTGKYSGKFNIWIKPNETVTLFNLSGNAEYTLNEIDTIGDKEIEDFDIIGNDIHGTVSVGTTQVSIENRLKPEIQTMAIGENNKKEILPKLESTIIDTVSYYNLIPSQEYKLKGSLHIKGESGEDKGIVANAEKTFTPASSSGTEELEFNFDSSELGGNSVVVFEKLFFGETEIASHEELTDINQSVKITLLTPEIRTTATGKDGTHTELASKQSEITDIVSYENLIIGKEYTLQGSLHKKNTDGTDGGIIATENKTFTPTQSDGSVSLIFNFDSTNLGDNTLVVFEKLYSNNKLIASHEDINDKGQTIDIVYETPSIRTSATGTDGTHEELVSEHSQITDVVSYEKLVIGKEYTLQGSLHKKNSDGTDGGIITVSNRTFTPSQSNGTVNLTFEFNSNELGNTSLVVFEKLYLNDKLVASHEDISDEGQTVKIIYKIPAIRTTAKGDNNTKKVAPKTNAKVIDVVQYTNLNPGEEYIMKGTLHLRGVDGKDAGGIANAEKKFTPTSSSGTVELTFTFDASKLQGQTVVVFEDCYSNGISVATHADINDKNQSVTIENTPKPTPAPTPTPTSTPKPTATPKPSATPQPTITPTPTQTSNTGVRTGDISTLPILVMIISGIFVSALMLAKKHLK